MSDDEQLAAEARRLAQASRWDEAGAAFAALGRRAADGGRRETAQQAWALAADAYRRDDRPAAAARALRVALDLLDGRDAAARARRLVARVTLAGVLMDSGELTEGTATAREAAAGAPSPASRVLALDVLSGALMAQGRVADARGPIAEMAAIAPPGARPAVAFRHAALCRLDGDLEGALAGLASVRGMAPDGVDWSGPVAVSHQESAEIYLLQDRFDDAAAGFSQAQDLWRTVRRRAGVFRCEAALARVAVARGLVSLTSGLDAPVRYAAERGMRVLEAELRLARGQASRAATGRDPHGDLDLAVGLAARIGALLLEGKARWARGGPGCAPAELARITRCFASDRVWLARVMTAASS